MAHIEIKATTIQKKTAVTRRCFVISIVQIDSANLTLAEEMIFNFYRPSIGLALSLILRDQTTVFSLEASYPVHAPGASGENPKLSTGTSLGLSHFRLIFSSRPSYCRRPRRLCFHHHLGGRHWPEDDTPPPEDE